MGTVKYRTLKAVIVPASIAVVTLVAAAGYARQHNHSMPMPSRMQPKKEAAKAPGSTKETLEAIHSKRLPALRASVEQAIRHTEAGHPQAALEELRRLQNSLVALQEALGRHLQPAYVNTRCPIMGSPIDPAKVTAELTREYQGQKVAFCCGGCPAAWDALTDTEKAAKLKSVMGEPRHGTN